METVKDSGWAWPLNARKAHFFVDGRSLCGRWLFFGKVHGGRGLQEANGSDDCKGCLTKVVARNAKADAILEKLFAEEDQKA